MTSYSIAIDGPAGAGKSTIAKKLAEELSFIYVDTGAMYRAMAFFVLQNKIDPKDEKAVSNACKDIEIKIDYKNKEQEIFLNNENVTSLIRSEEIGNAASDVSKHFHVRKKMVDLQQNLAYHSNVVMDGRDIATVVLPNANLKIYLTASTDQRAKRRFLDLKEKGIKGDFDKIREDIIARDYQDMNRENSPLVQAKDAIVIDSSKMSIEEVVGEIIKIFKEKVDL